MIKQLLNTTILLLSLSTFTNADFLLYLEQDNEAGSEAYCITDYYYANKRIYFLQSNDDRYDNKRLRDYSSVQIRAGYIFDIDNDICIVANINTSEYEATNELSINNYNNYNNLSFLGISLEYFNSLMALSGILISFIFLYGLTRFI